MSSLRELVRIILANEWPEVTDEQESPVVSDLRWNSSRPRLDEVAARLLPIIAADGIAIAFREGDKFVSKISEGYAPRVGSVIEPGVGQCGMCIQQGRTVVEQEMEDEAKSLVAVPVYAGSRLTGCLAAFSMRARAFREIDIETVVAVASHLGEWDGVPESAQIDEDQDYLAKLHEYLYPGDGRRFGT